VVIVAVVTLRKISNRASLIVRLVEKNRAGFHARNRRHDTAFHLT
jgi:hypothetical protein